MKSSNIIAFVGMPGSGKTSCANYLADKGYPIVYFGGLVVDEVKSRNMAVTESSERAVREDLRNQHGMAALAVLATNPINKMLGEYGSCVIDGLYSWSELLYLRERYDSMTVIGIITDKDIRYKRLEIRQERPLTNAEVDTRDVSEIENLEKGGPIAYADKYILNNEEDDEHYSILRSKIDIILSDIKFPDIV